METIIVDLPSRGICYPHKKGTAEVRLLSVHDENDIANSKVEWWKDSAMDKVLDRLIVDEEFTADNLYFADRQAILLKLRMASYGNECRHVDQNGAETTVDLSKIGYTECLSEADGEGLFTYFAKGLTLLKYRLMTRKDEKECMGLVMKDESTIEEMRRTLAKMLTVHACYAVNDDEFDVERYIDAMEYADLISYVKAINNASPRVDSDLDFEEILTNEIIREAVAA